MGPVRIVAMVLALALSAGCQAIPIPSVFTSKPVDLPIEWSSRTAQIWLSSGQSARLKLGEYSASIGDSWTVLTDSNPGVADAVVNGEYAADAPPGSSAPYYLEVVARKRGKTELELRYCYRSKPAADCDQGPNADDKHANIQITVTVS